MVASRRSVSTFRLASAGCISGPTSAPGPRTGFSVRLPGLLTAVACVATVPVVVLFLALQRYYTKGLIGGSIK